MPAPDGMKKGGNWNMNVWCSAAAFLLLTAGFFGIFCRVREGDELRKAARLKKREGGMRLKKEKHSG